MDNALGDFLRARRELVTPGEVGLAPGNGLRRVPGLRREEVALLAGISAEYYIRLEQGRDRCPSPQVIDALSAVLQLDHEGTSYLAALAAPRSRRRRAERPAGVPPGLEQLLRTINVPAMVIDGYLTVLAANDLARAVSPGMEPGTNELRSLFLDPAAGEHHLDWEQTAASSVAHLRARAGSHPDDERLHALIGEMSLKSVRFRRLWARHDVLLVHGGGRIRLRHPRAGVLELLVEKFAVVGAPGLETVLLHADPGSATAEALTALSLPAGRTPPAG